MAQGLFACISAACAHSLAAAWVFLTGLPVYLVRLASLVRCLEKMIVAATGEHSPRPPSPLFVLPGLCFSRLICWLSSLRDRCGSAEISLAPGSRK